MELVTIYHLSRSFISGGRQGKRRVKNVVNIDEQNQYNQGVDDVVQAIKDLVSENPTDCFSQIVSDLDQIASDLKECEA